MSIAQGVRMAGQVLGGLGAVAKAYPAQAALLGAGVVAPPILGYTHGRVAGYNDPSKGGLGGTLGYTVLGNPLGGLAYGLGHQGGREAAQPNDLSPQEIKQIQEYLKQQEWEKRKQMLQGIMNPVVIKN